MKNYVKQSEPTLSDSGALYYVAQHKPYMEMKRRRMVRYIVLSAFAITNLVILWLILRP